LSFLTEDEVLRMDVLSDVDKERTRQNELWGKQKHSLGDWLKILVEEVGEVAQAMQKEKDWGKDSDASNLYEELVHTAAVAVAIAEQVKEKRDELERN
jgi:NTP pyrophosphatase (non-canonical NTP hydrolase)